MSTVSQSEGDSSIAHRRTSVSSKSSSATRESISNPISSDKQPEQAQKPEGDPKKGDDGQIACDNPPSVSTISLAERDALAARTGETVTDETLFVIPEETTKHVSAFHEPVKQLEKADDDESASITESLVSLRTHAHRAFKKSGKMIKKSVSMISSPPKLHEPAWEKANKGLSTVNHDDANVLRQVLEVAKENYDSDKIYIRKVHTGTYGQFVEWQVKFEHKTRGYKENARTLKDAARKLKSYLDYKEPGDLDDRFKGLYDRIRSDERFSGALILFKEGKPKDLYPWKVRVHHEAYGFNKAADTLARAISAMEEHLEYQEATTEEQKGVIWERIFKILDNYPKCKVFYKDGTRDGPDGEPEKVWYMKIDHPNRGIQFEARSRIFEEAAGQIYDYLKEEREVTKTKA